MASDTLSLLRDGRLAGATELNLSGLNLEEVPPEVFALADTLELLNLSQNRLTALPDELATLRRLRILFCSGNHFTAVPEAAGACPELSMVGFKSNAIRSISADALPAKLRWLILTDNQIRELPANLGQRPQLQKLMLAGNQLSALPEEMSACHQLELIRLASNDFKELPPWLFQLPRLAWLAFAGNPCSPAPDLSSSPLPEMAWTEFTLSRKLGEGASGVIHQAVWKSQRDVAVKIFKGTVTSDGLPENEMAACMAAGSHANLIPVLGRVQNHPQNSMGLVLELIDPAYQNLAAPPSFETCTRDVYADNLRFDLATVHYMIRGVASAAAQLHGRGLVHGDLYAHNLLWRAGGHCLLGDFGAASFYAGEEVERLEVRAFGCLLEELLDRCEGPPQTLDALRGLQNDCLSPDVKKRPRFAEIQQVLDSLAAAGGMRNGTPIS